MTTQTLRVLYSAALATCLIFTAPVLAQQKTSKQCNEEWKANEAALQASGKTKKAFIAECRGTAAATSGATSPGAAPAAPTLAQQKTSKQCNAEWKANESALQASGKTKKAFLAECRGTAAATSGATSPGAAPAAPTLAQQKTSKQCNAEWKANQAALQASGKTRKAFIAECRGTAAATSGATLAPETATKPPVHGKPGTPAAAGEFSTEAQAKAHCPADNVVWVNLASKVYHFSGSRSYGNTEKGAYMCERDTAAAGFRAAKNEKHP